MPNIYLIRLKNEGRYRLLSWTARPSPKAAWEKFLQEFGKFTAGRTIAEQKRELQRRDGAHCIKIAVEADSVH